MSTKNQVTAAVDSPVKLIPSESSVLAFLTPSRIMFMVSLIKQLYKFVNSPQGQEFTTYIMESKQGVLRQMVHDLGVRLIKMSGVDRAE